MKGWKRDQIISRISSKHNTTLEVAIEDGKMVLNTDNGNYSFGNLHIVFEEVFRLEKIDTKQYKNILLLGMGAGSVIALLKNNFKQHGSFTAVEIDEEIIAIARNYFNLNNHEDLRVEHADAYDFVCGSEEIFDLIIVDIYIDLDIPIQFESKLFIDHLMRITAEGSKIIFNKVVQSNAQRKQFAALLALFENCAPTYFYTLMGFNKILVCSR